MAKEEDDPEFEKLLSYLPDEDPNSSLAVASRKISEMTPEMFIKILERTAPGNPYAEELLKAAKEKYLKK